MAKEVFGSSTLTSRSSTSLCVLFPVKALSGISPKICAKVSLLKSGAAVKVWNAMLAFVPLVELVIRETDKKVAERLSGVRKRLANSPDCLNLRRVVWAGMTRGSNTIKAAARSYIMSFSSASYLGTLRWERCNNWAGLQWEVLEGIIPLRSLIATAILNCNNYLDGRCVNRCQTRPLPSYFSNHGRGWCW